MPPRAPTTTPTARLTIARQTARRFVLGRQGLWPGRRWRGARGTRSAMLAIEHLQLDPLHMIARSQDITLASRVIDYVPDDWEQQTYSKRRFFDWGGWLAVRPMQELPYFRNVMRREQASLSGLRATAREHAGAITEMRGLLLAGDTLSNRNFAASSRVRTDNYRGRKDSAVALYYLWRVGEAMVHHRERFERVYAHAEQVAPADLLGEHDDAATDRFLFRKYVAFQGLTALTGIGWTMGVKLTSAQLKRLRQDLVAAGELVEVSVEDTRGPHYVLAEDLPTLSALDAGRVPRAWKALDTSSTDEAVFLAPLDPVSARGRAQQLFDFDYVWEVYKPEHERRWGYYTLPILWGDALVARFDSSFDRASATLVVKRLWLERDELGRDTNFAAALGRGMRRFARFVGARRVTAEGISQKLLRQVVVAAGQELD